MKENEVSYRILYIDGERIISEESVIGSNSILEQLESIIAKIELSKPTGQLQSITDIPNNTGNSFNIFRKLRFQISSYINSIYFNLDFKESSSSKSFSKFFFISSSWATNPPRRAISLASTLREIITSPPIV